MTKDKGFLVLGVLFLSMAMIMGGCTMGARESVAAEQYPSKPITIIVPSAAGGGSDLMARALEKSAYKHLGQPLVVVDMPGGGATLGMNELAGAKPDGYTIGVVATSAILQPLIGQTRYHYPSALEPLVNVVSSPVVVVCLTDKPWKNLIELVSYAKQHPGEIKFGHSGLGTSVHVTEETFAREAGITIKQVPFRGGESEALAALLGGHVQLIGVYNPAVIKEHVKSGTIRILGVAEENRLTLPGFEDVPTFKEQGINVAFNFWTGIAAPKEMPLAEKARLADGLREMVNDPEFKENMEKLGMSVHYLGPEDFGDRWIADNKKLTKIVKETGIAELIAAQKN